MFSIVCRDFEIVFLGQITLICEWNFQNQEWEKTKFPPGDRGHLQSFLPREG